MLNSKIIDQCIKKLEGYKSTLSYIEGDSQSSSGYNCAIDCVNDSIKTRIDSLSDSLREYEPDDNIDEKCECFNEISSMLAVLNADCQNLSGNEFDDAFKRRLSECIEDLYAILEEYS